MVHTSLVLLEVASIVIQILRHHSVIEGRGADALVGHGEWTGAPVCHTLVVRLELV